MTPAMDPLKHAALLAKQEEDQQEVQRLLSSSHRMLRHLGELALKRKLLDAISAVAHRRAIGHFQRHGALNSEFADTLRTPRRHRRPSESIPRMDDRAYLAYIGVSL